MRDVNGKVLRGERGLTDVLPSKIQKNLAQHRNAKYKFEVTFSEKYTMMQIFKMIKGS